MKRTKLKTLIVTGLVLAVSVTSMIGCGSAAKQQQANTSEAIMDSVTSVQTKLTNAKLDGEKADAAGTVLTTVVSFNPPPACHGNPLVNGGPDWSVEPIIYDYLCDYSFSPEKTFKPSLLESYTFEDKLLTLKLKKDLKWSDGSPITADDLKCNIFMDMTVNKVAYFAESVTKVDDLTIEIKYNTDANLLLDYILKSPLRYPVDAYGKWASVYESEFNNSRVLNADGKFEFTKEGDKKVGDTTTDLNSYLPDLLSIKCSGAYVPKTITSSETIFERNPYYRIPLYIEKIKGVRATSTESSALAISNGDYDAEGIGLSPDMAQKVAEKNKETIRQMVVPEYSAIGFCMNSKSYPTNDINVRKAIAYIVDTAQIAPVSEPGMVKGDEYGVGLPPSIRDKYLSKDFLGGLEKYGVNLDKAKEYLEKAGWKKNGNQWVDAKGESPEITIAGVGEFPAYVVIGEAAANMLKDFGLNASFTPKEAAAYNDYAQSGQASMVIDGFGSVTGTQNPYEAYDSIYWYGKRGLQFDIPVSGGKLVLKDEKTGEDFPYTDKETALFAASNDEEIGKASEDFAKFYNDNMWYLPVTEKYYVYRIHNDKLSMPAGETGKEMHDFYWSGTTSAILGKAIRGEQLYYVK